jgi:glycosyltransferase involved in cell wall biosynthesis
LKKILHVTHTDIRFDNRIIKEIDALSAYNEFYVWGVGMSLDEGSAENSLNDVKAEIITLKVRSRKIKYLPKPVRHILTFFELSIYVVQLYRKIQPQIIHCHDTLVLPIGWLIKKFNDKLILIYDAHELESNKNGQTWLLSKITLVIEKICWKKIDFLITVSPSILTWYTNNLGPKKSSIILNSPASHNFVCNENIEKNNFEKHYFNKKFAIPLEKNIYIYLGALTKGRCIDVLLDVFSSPDIFSHIIFIGFGPLKGKIIDYTNLHFNIHYHDSVQHDLVVDLVKNADIGLCLIENVSLSDYYCLPNKLFEYTFSGLSILGSNFPDIAEVVEKYKLGNICNIDYDSIFTSIFNTQKYPKQKNQFEKIDELSWEKQSENLINAYKNLLFN